MEQLFYDVVGAYENWIREIAHLVRPLITSIYGTSISIEAPRGSRDRQKRGNFMLMKNFMTASRAQGPMYEYSWQMFLSRALAN